MGTISLNSITNGTDGDATEVDGNFTTIKTLLNGNIDEDNLAAGAEILMSKITATPSDAKLVDVQENFLDGCWLTRDSDTVLSVGAGSAMINGELRRNTSALTDTPSLTASKWNDVYLVADTTTSTFTIDVQTNQATPGASNPGTSGTNVRLIGSIFCDSDTDITGVKLVNFRNDEIEGTSYLTGAGSATMTETITLGVTMDSVDMSAPGMIFIGRKTTANNPETVAEFQDTAPGNSVLWPDNIGTTTFLASWNSGGTFLNAQFYGYKWKIKGSFT